jgi:hypothetical protein
MLEGMLAQWKAEEGSVPDERVWAALMRAAGHALGGLVAAYACQWTETAIAHLVEQIGWALKWRDVHGNLQAARTADNADIVDALLALLEESERRYKEHQQGAAGLAAATASDAG